MADTFLMTETDPIRTPNSNRAIKRIGECKGYAKAVHKLPSGQHQTILRIFELERSLGGFLEHHPSTEK